LYRERFVEGFEQIFREIKEVKKLLISEYNPQNFKVFQLEGKTVQYVKSKMVKYNPSLVIIDICDTLVNDVESPPLLKRLYDQLRQMSGTHCPVIGTSQSVETSYVDKEGHPGTVLNLEMKHLYGCRQKGGAADTVIGIGGEEHGTVRRINIAKLKRGVAARFDVEQEGIYSNYKEIKW
jgi:hypothetical protein